MSQPSLLSTGLRLTTPARRVMYVKEEADRRCRRGQALAPPAKLKKMRGHTCAMNLDRSKPCANSAVGYGGGRVLEPK